MPNYRKITEKFFELSEKKTEELHDLLDRVRPLFEKYSNPLLTKAQRLALDIIFENELTDEEKKQLDTLYYLERNAVGGYFFTMLAENKPESEAPWILAYDQWRDQEPECGRTLCECCDRSIYDRCHGYSACWSCPYFCLDSEKDRNLIESIEGLSEYGIIFQPAMERESFLKGIAHSKLTPPPNLSALPTCWPKAKWEPYISPSEF